MFLKRKELNHLLRTSGDVLSGQAFTNYRKLLARLLQDYQSPIFARLSTLLREKDFTGLIEEADFLSKQTYGEARDHFLANQFAALIKKYPFPSSAVKTDPLGKAKSTFLSAEHKCSRMNVKFRLYDTLRCPISSELAQMRNFVAYVLGDFDLSEILDDCDFGPGASIGAKSTETDFISKLSRKWTVTPGALPYAYSAVSRDFHLRVGMFSDLRDGFYCFDAAPSDRKKFEQRVHVVKHNKISFVPKTAKTHRAIAVEPLFSGYLQKGADNLIRKKLQRIGIDLTDQERNKEWARKGSILDSEDSFVTIDLSSASDSMSIGLVRNLLPPDWFSYLDSIRSHYYSLDGRIIRYAKFCSMGNGFCFPLETLLFCAMANAANCGQPGVDYSIYGDDIIVRKRFAPRLLSLLKSCGFATNTDKTFLQGPFRESCGADWFGGEDVRPFTLDFALDDLQSVFKFLNLTRRNSRTTEFFKTLRPFIWSLVPKPLRFVRPFAGPDDTCVTSDGDEHLISDTCVYKRGRWIWLALEHKPVINFQVYSRSSSIFLERVLLRGGTSSVNSRIKYFPEVTMRLTTHTKITRESYMSTSNWLPSPRAC